MLLLDDVACGLWLDAGRQHAQQVHGLVVAAGVVLCHFHRLELLKPCFLGNFVLAFVGIVFQVPHIGDVAHIAHFVTQVLKVAEEHIEGDGRAGVAQVGVAIDGGSAHVHAHVRLVERHKLFFAPCEGVIDVKRMVHCVAVKGVME